VVFRPTSAALPTDRRVAILGSKREGKTVLLEILARITAPDQGRVVAGSGLSPVINSGGLLHPQLSVLENIRFLSRTFGIEAEQLAIAVHAFAGKGVSLHAPLRSLDPAPRRAIEATLAIALPFECYLLDNISQMAPEMLKLTFQTAARRQAGVIFATSNPRLSGQLANFAVVISDQRLHPFSDVKEAIRFYERQPRQ
jgi:capsular polysaccharide transport system ATP-binding protein